MKNFFLIPILLTSFVLLGCKSNKSTPVVQQQRATQQTAPVIQHELGSWEDLQSLIAKMDNRISGVKTAGDKVSTVRNFYLIFDGSGSMRGNKIKQAKKAITTVIKGLPKDYNLGLFIFDSRGTREEVALGPNNHNRIIAAVENSVANGGTPLGTSINTGVQKLAHQYRQQLGYGEFRLIVITDGESDRNDPITRGTTPAARLGIPIYTIGFNVRGHRLEQYSAFFTTASDEAQLRAGLGQVFGELDSFESFDSK